MIKQHFIAAIALLSAPLLASTSHAALTWNYNGVIGLTSSVVNTSETDGSVTFTAVRVGGRHGAVSVTYATVNETAVAGENFTPGSGTLSWADGDASSKTFTIPILNSSAFTSGSKWFLVTLTAGTGAVLGTPNHASVNIAAAGTTTGSKSIGAWVSCNPAIDESAQVEQAIYAAANHFTLVVDCPVRFHTGAAALRSISVPDGVTIQFQGAGEFLIVGSGPPALTIANPAQVSFVDWNLNFL